MTAPPQHGGHLLYGLEADPNGLDPSKNAWDQAGIELANALFDPLFAYDADGVARPYLAESTEHDESFTHWKLRLRPGIKFHDGTPVNAAALVRHLRAIQESLITGPPAQFIDEATRVDDLTAEISMKKPWATFVELMTGQGGYLAAPSQLDNPMGHSQPVGSGPFKLEKWQENERFHLVRNPDYWRPGLPYLDEITFEVVPDGVKRLNMLRRGDLDLTNLSFPSEVAELDKVMAAQQGGSGGAAPLTVERDPGATEANYILFNTTHAPLDDVRIRRAIYHATDIAKLAALNGWPKERLAQGVFAPGSPFFVQTEYPGYDLAKARALVKEYLAEKKKRTVTFNFGVSYEPELVQQLVAMWAEAGIEAKIEAFDWKLAVRIAVIGSYDAMMFRYFAAVDPDVLWHFFAASTVRKQGELSLNFAHFADRQIDDALNEGRSTLDPVVRQRAYAKFQQRLADQVPYLWLVRSEWYIVSGARIRNPRNVVLPDGRPAMPFGAGTQRLTETWIDTGAPST